MKKMKKIFFSTGLSTSPLAPSVPELVQQFSMQAKGVVCQFPNSDFTESVWKKGFVPEVILKADRLWTIEATFFFSLQNGI